MIEVSFFCERLFKAGTDFFTGVPDSLLKSFCIYITDNVKAENHIIAANEGAAVALASGYHLATGRIPLVYMQNSGIGNAVNPLLSLADPEVYQIPMVLLIGWRGEPGVKDEPQHVKQGKVTCSMLDTMGIPYAIMADNEEDLEKQLSVMYDHFSKNNSPYGLVVRKDAFSQYKIQNAPVSEETLFLTREAAIEEILRISLSDEFYVSTTGMASRELYELRKKLGLSHDRDFLTVGSMGHASQIALGIALQKPEQPVTCLDGDGAVLMHTGSLAIIGSRKPRNFRHIVLNNGAHDSVGGQPTVGLQINIPSIALACGYKKALSVRNIDGLQIALTEIDKEKRCGPVLIEVCVCKGARTDLGRPDSSPIENKKIFMETLSNKG
jgi:phosphonopyruvate decarboxylase